MRRRIEVAAAVLAVSALITGVAVAASSPAVVTGGHSSVKQESAVLSGTVNPNGNATSYYFRWGLTTAYGVNGSPHPAGSGTKSVTAKTTATGLIPGTKYHYQLVATNGFGTSAGADHTFTTAGHPPPAATTGPTTQPGPSSATVTGVINPQGEQTNWSFQYGTTTSYGSSTFGGTVPAGSAPETVSSSLQGLASGTIFHYRLLAQHPGSSVVSYGADQIFMTFPVPRPLAHISAQNRPLRKRQAPWVFTASGTISGPSSIPSIFYCNGQVAIKSFYGKRRVGYAVAPVQRNCTFSGQFTFQRKPPGHGPKNRVVRLKVQIRFLGNGYLAPVGARPKTIVLG
jgi:hypothetical protein